MSKDRRWRRRIPGLSERELVRRAAAGDANAYRALIERHGDAALRAALIVTRNQADAQDVCQEAFVKAFHALPSFRERSSFRTWLFRIVTNQALNHMRGEARRRRLEIDLVPGPATDPFEDVIDDRALLDAITDLPDDDRALLGWRFFADLSVQETADVLEIPAGTVKSRQSAAVARLRRSLEPSQASLREVTDG